MEKHSKSEVLTEVVELIKGGELGLQELTDTYHKNAPAGTPENSKAHSLSRALYAVGTLIVCLGICLLIGQNWNEMSPLARIFSTFGIGTAVFTAALIHTKRAPDVNEDFLSNSLFTIASVALAVGAGVIAAEAGAKLSEPGTFGVICLVVSMVFGLLYMFAVRSLVLVVAGIAAALGAYYCGVVASLEDVNSTAENYLLLLGAAGAGGLLALGSWFTRGRVVLSKLTVILADIAALFVLGAAYGLTFQEIAGSTALWDVLFPVALALGIWVSVWLNSRNVLAMTALFLTAHIFKVSFVYFADVLGGSVALCLGGVLVIGIGYSATNFAKRYIKT